MKIIEKEDATDVVRSTINRRAFFKGVGATGLGLAGAALIGSRFGANESTVHAASGVSDEAILNFALNLEYLEAEFYLMSTYNTTLERHGVLKSNEVSGPTTGGKRVDFTHLGYLATQLRTDEIDHVLFLRKALGSAAVKKPAINLDALGYGFGGVNDWLKLSRQFEDVGVSAYLGAAPLISSSQYLAAAAAILSTEAFHAGSIRVQCLMMNAPSPAVDSIDVPVAPPKNHPLFAEDSNALAIPRTTSQVLNVVYGGGQCSGGFYPDGMNGEIVCQS